MEDPARDETRSIGSERRLQLERKLQGRLELERPTLCTFCAIVFSAPTTGRPPSYCGKRCRQAASRERTARRGGPDRRQRRRRELRADAELAAGVPIGEAWDRARKAWPALPPRALR